MFGRVKVFYGKAMFEIDCLVSTLGHSNFGKPSYRIGFRRRGRGILTQNVKGQTFKFFKTSPLPLSLDTWREGADRKFY